MRVLFCWTDTSGYMAACWRSLASAPGVRLDVFANNCSTQTSFSADLMEGVRWTPVPTEKRHDAAWLTAHVEQIDPDVVVLSGWANPAYRALVLKSGAKRPRFILAMDTPWQGTTKQWLARLALWRYLRRIDAVFVPGERGWQYAKRLGFQEKQIYRGLYGVDWAYFSNALTDRTHAKEWPKRFLFVGRYTAVKGLDSLIAAYADYRSRVSTPWPLVCCGRGPLGYLLADTPGVTDKGFLQPEAVTKEMVSSGALLLPSTFDPWPLALVEGCAAGLPVVCSEACGSSVELIRDGHSGFTFPTGNHDRFVDTLLRVHTATDLHAIGTRAQAFAAAYSTHEWSNRWIQALERILV